LDEYVISSLGVEEGNKQEITMKQVAVAVSWLASGNN
jgi:hypothetical protein